MEQNYIYNIRKHKYCFEAFDSLNENYITTNVLKMYYYTKLILII